MAKAESAGMSTERLARIAPFIQERYLDTGRLPCAQTMVWRRGQLVHHSVQGMADPERGVALKEDAIFRIYSMTKPITSIAFMMLVEEGKVALDDPVHRYIPAFRDLAVYQAGTPEGWLTRPAEQPMRCIDLLRHTSGLTYGFQMRTNVDAAYRKAGVSNFDTEGGLPAMIDQLAKIPLEFTPGTAWNYSVSTDVLGYLVEQISGLPLERFFAERILGPLQMNDTAFWVPEDKLGRFTACYQRAPSGKITLQDDAQTGFYTKEPPLKSGGGGLTGTAADYLRFVRMLLNGGELDGQRIISPKTLRLMTLNHLPGGQELVQASRGAFSEAVFEGLGFGLGFAMTIDLARTKVPGSLGEYFWGGMASTAFWVDPVEDLACVFMTQLMPSSSYPIRRELRTLVYAAMEESNAG